MKISRLSTLALALLLCGLAIGQTIDTVALTDKATQNEAAARALRDQASEIAKTAANPPCQYIILKPDGNGGLTVAVSIPPGASGVVNVGPICAFIIARPAFDPAALKQLQDLQSRAATLETEAVLLRHQVALIRATESAETRIQQTATVLNKPDTPKNHSNPEK